MTDVFSKKKRSQVMAAIKSKGNKDTELKLISIFRANGITGWRRNQKLPGNLPGLASAKFEDYRRGLNFK